MGFEYDTGTGELEPHFHLGEGEPAIVDGSPVNDQEFAIDAITVRVLGPTQPGAGGSSMVYLLPQDEGLAASLGNPFAGIAVEEVPSGIFVSDLLSLSLVTVSGPGDFSLWETGSLGGDTLLLSNVPGSGAAGNVNLTKPPGHFHFNIGFSEAGIYDVTYRAEGDLVAGGSADAEFTVRYQVVPEPSSLILALLGLSAGLIRRRR